MSSACSTISQGWDHQVGVAGHGEGAEPGGALVVMLWAPLGCVRLPYGGQCWGCLLSPYSCALQRRFL